MPKQITIKASDTKGSLDKLATKINLLRQAREEVRQMNAYIEQMEAEIEAEMKKNGATVGTVNGAPVFTYRPASSYALAKFRDAHPEVYAKYVTKQLTDVVDTEALVKDHGQGILAPFQTHRLTYVG